MSPCALYRHFDDLGTLLYVGISQDPHVRSAGHVAGSEWVQFARYRMVDLEKWAANRPSVVRETDRP